LWDQRRNERWDDEGEENGEHIADDEETVGRLWNGTRFCGSAEETCELGVFVEAEPDIYSGGAGELLDCACLLGDVVGVARRVGGEGVADVGSEERAGVDHLVEMVSGQYGNGKGRRHYEHEVKGRLPDEDMGTGDERLEGELDAGEEIMATGCVLDNGPSRKNQRQ
jgi:hypothetical protein